MELLGVKSLSKVERLKEALEGKRALLVLTHTNPDPDAMASAAALIHIVTDGLGKKALFAYSGDIFRAENKSMVKALDLKMTPFNEVDPDAFDSFALVDTQPAFGHTILPTGVFPDIVVDHHVATPGVALETPFVDTRPNVGATASIMTEYLMDLDGEIPPELATALSYGIMTDTADLSRNVSPLDLKANAFLFDFVDRKLLREITNPTVPVAYFRALRKALSSVEVFGCAVISSLKRVDNPEMVAEVADFLLRLEGATWAVCGGLFNSTYYISVRAADGQGKDSWLLLRDVLKGEGSFGGHGSVSGGRIPLVDDSDRGLRKLELELKRSLLEALGERGTVPVKLG